MSKLAKTPQIPSELAHLDLDSFTVKLEVCELCDVLPVDGCPACNGKGEVAWVVSAPIN